MYLFEVKIFQIDILVDFTYYITIVQYIAYLLIFYCKLQKVLDTKTVVS